MKTYIFGHKNPDTDSICAAVSYAYLKNQLGEDCEPKRLGDIQKETEFVLNYFGVCPPELLDNVKIQVRDLKYTKMTPIQKEHSILHAYREMQDHRLKTMAIVDEQEHLLGLVTMQDIAMDMIQGDFYNIDTSIANIVEGLKARMLHVPDPQMRVCGKVAVVAYYLASGETVLTKDRIIIVGDRYDVIESAIMHQVKLIIVSGNFDLPQKYIKLAEEKKVPIIVAPQDTYIVSKTIQFCNFISTVMEDEVLIKFNEVDYLDDIKDDIIKSSYRNFPVISQEGKFLGFVGRKHLLSLGRKKVILVDHNEFAQSADGIEEAEILEVIDHHKIGGLSTNLPIRFINMPVGSSCTIIYQQYQIHGIVPTREMAGLMISGILSDTLYFKSPTTTAKDREVVQELNRIVQIDLQKYFMEMSRIGTSIEGYSEEEILYRDCKEFSLKQYRIAVSQIFTLDIEEVLKRKEALLSYMEKERKRKGYEEMIFVVTDIIREGSYFFYAGELNGLIEGSFEVENRQGVFVPYTVSRKKQILPMLMSYAENYL